nr:phosphatase PAP2 family protein [Alkaliphilus hydrothermalis]
MYFLISIYVNSVVKATTAVPRPSGDEVRILYKESTLGTSSFPSGHTQGTASFWGYMAYYIKNKAFTALAVVIIILVGLSRMYLGLHFPIDILGGLSFALVILWLFNQFYDDLVKKMKTLSFQTGILLSIILPLFLLLPPSHDKGMLVGFVIGLLVGYQVEGTTLGFQSDATFGKQVVKFVIGVAGFFGLRFILKALFLQIGFSDTAPLAADVIRYSIIGLWASYIAPLVFVKFGLSTVGGGFPRTPAGKAVTR